MSTLETSLLTAWIDFARADLIAGDLAAAEKRLSAGLHTVAAITGGAR